MFWDSLVCVEWVPRGGAYPAAGEGVDVVSGDAAVRTVGGPVWRRGEVVGALALEVVGSDLPRDDGGLVLGSAVLIVACHSLATDRCDLRQGSETHRMARCTASTSIGGRSCC